MSSIARPELADLLAQKNVQRNLSTPKLVEAAIRNGEGMLSSRGALVSETGKRTGRSPKDKFTVKDAITENKVAWGSVNLPFSPDKFDALYDRVLEYLQGKEVYVQDLFCGADPRYQLPIQVINEYAWHNLFVRQLFIRPTAEELKTHKPEFTIVSAPGFLADPKRDGTNSEVFVIVNFTRRMVIIGGTQYAGEMKKSIFGVMNFVLPPRNVFPMHCSANIGEDGVTALFFGLSGTGKTTLSADPTRRLIGDDEHGWSEDGVFNFEGGCYAKCIKLSEQNEPQIWNALDFGAVLENVVLDPVTRVPNYDDDSKTENTRAAYPVEHIDNAVIPGFGGHPKNVVFLTADAFGVLPPVSKLTPEQAMFHFMSGYTAKVAGTEAGVTEPQATFSTCFGAPFMPLPPKVYAEMLGQPPARAQRAMLAGQYRLAGRSVRRRQAHEPALHPRHGQRAGRRPAEQCEFEIEPAFGLSIPKSVPGVPAELLNPRNSWKDKAAYDKMAAELSARFAKNFEQFDAPREIKEAGPRAVVAK